MTDRTPPSTLRLVLVPSLVTLAVSAARTWMEIDGRVTRASGGAGSWLGITWLALLFGGWFGVRLAAAGDRPRLRPAPLWFGIATAVLIGAVIAVFRHLDPADRSPEALRILDAGAPWVAAAALAMAGLALVTWTRLAWALLVYGAIARITVVAITWWVKRAGHDTHYTKFGPPGFEFDLAETMGRAALAQLAFWVPFTIVVGGFTGTVAAALARRLGILSRG